MEQRGTPNSLISRRSFLRIAGQGGTAALVAVCTAGVMAVPTMAAPTLAPPTLAATAEEQQGPAATGKRANVARERTVISEYISGRNANPEVYNPFIANIVMHTGLQQACIESIQYLNLETGKEEPWQIESFAYDPGFMGVTMTVRQGVMWSDGMPFTPNDIVFTLNMLKANAPELTFSQDTQKWVQDATVNGPDVHITFTAPNPRFMTQFFATLYNSVYIVPEHIWKDQDPKTFTNYDLTKGWPVFTGPYTLTSSNELQMVWDRNDNWWGAKVKPAIGGNDRKTPLNLPAPERLIMIGVENAENRAAKAIANEMDTFWHMPRSVFEAVAKANPNIKSWFPDLPYAYFDPAPRHLAFNLKAPPFDNRDVRWAISYAIDRQKIVDFAYEGITTVTDVFFPLTPAMAVFRNSAKDLFDTYPASKLDLTESANRMTAAGFTLGSDGKWVDAQGNTVVMQVNVRGGEEDQIRIAPILSDQLNAAGFDASFKITEAGALYDGIARGDILTNLQLIGGTAVNVSDPWGSFDLLHSRYSAPIGQVATGQRSRFENAEFDAAVDAMSKITTGDPKMKDLFHTAMEIILREMPIVPLVQTALLTPNNYTYWTNWPDFQDQIKPNNYASPSQWWGSFYHSLLAIQPTRQPSA
ncbi:MAG: ABC transporter substrate-binding protein [Chloroflexota bacterium]|nr:ABC transporter substrate-binding protein [Chloroflexota bacterium]